MYNVYKIYTLKCIFNNHTYYTYEVGIPMQ